MMPVTDAPPSPGHVALVVGAYDATLGQLRAAGHNAEPRPEHWGSPRCFVRDPAGNIVELMAWAPGSKLKRGTEHER